MKSYFWLGGIIVVLIAIMFWSVKGATTGNPTFEVGVVNASDNVKGNASSSVVVVEYSDFQCPACRSYYFVVRELNVEFGDKVAFVYRNFPLTEIHINSEFAARAAQAAAKQGKFWEMHDLLFEKQDEWAKVNDIESMLTSYATLIGLSVDQFKTDWASQEVINFVKAQRADAIKLGLQGTPSFFINGKQIENPSSTEAFRTLIREALKNQ